MLELGFEGWGQGLFLFFLSFFLLFFLHES